MVFARIHQYLSMATPLLWTRQADTIGVLGLALNTCNERNGQLVELDDIRELLTAARDLWRTLPEVAEHERQTHVRATFRLIHIADILAVTPEAAMTSKEQLLPRRRRPAEPVASAKLDAERA
jgi:hypothetical protein